MSRDYLLVIDQGTTSTRGVIYDAQLQIVGQSQIEVPPTYPKSGWVEHEPRQILNSVDSTIAEALSKSGLRADRIAAIGLTNQRETTIVWDRRTGVPIGPALVWQDRRTAEICDRLRDREPWIRDQTGLVIDPYFSATQISWLLDRTPGARERADRGELAAGTVDSYVIRHLTAGRRFVTDQTNASRTLLMGLKSIRWEPELCDYFGVPIGLLAEILPSSGEFGKTQGLGCLPDGIPIMGVAGDQQASLVGQGCWEAGQAKCTYGTGAFLLAHTGAQAVPSKSGLITTLAASVEPGSSQYALEGSVFVAGAAVQWFRDGLKAIGAAPEIDRLSLDGDPEADVIFVPALTGLGAPHWNPEARGTIFGLTRATSIADLAAATLQGVAYQVADLIDAITADLGRPLTELRADGGMARSDPFLQFQTDLMGIPIRRSPHTESTALGAALLAGLGVGLWSGRQAVLDLLRTGATEFSPGRSASWRSKSLDRWRHAVRTVNTHYGQGGNVAVN